MCSVVKGFSSIVLRMLKLKLHLFPFVSICCRFLHNKSTTIHNISEQVDLVEFEFNPLHHKLRLAPKTSVLSKSVIYSENSSPSGLLSYYLLLSHSEKSRNSDTFMQIDESFPFSYTII